jgi:hypothetical protein
MEHGDLRDKKKNNEMKQSIPLALQTTIIQRGLFCLDLQSNYNIYIHIHTLYT